jgi:hypothetical protein
MQQMAALVQKYNLKGSLSSGKSMRALAFGYKGGHGRPAINAKT